MQTKFPRPRMHTTLSHFTVNTCYQLEEPLPVSLVDITCEQSLTSTRHYFQRFPKTLQT